MFGKYFLATLVLGGAGAMIAADDQTSPTFNKDVLPILQKNCQTCHLNYAPGGARHLMRCD